MVTIALGCIMALGIILGLGSGAMAKEADANFFDYALVFVVLAAGTAFTMWIGERITEKQHRQRRVAADLCRYHRQLPRRGLYRHPVCDRQTPSRRGSSRS